MEINPYYEQELIHALINVVKLQTQLRQFTFVGKDKTEDFRGIILANENPKKTLREVINGGCPYDDEFKILKNCENLTSVSERAI